MMCCIQEITDKNLCAWCFTPENVEKNVSGYWHGKAPIAVLQNIILIFNFTYP